MSNPQDTDSCTVPPEGWICSRVKGHEGPCAAYRKAPKSAHELLDYMIADKPFQWEGQTYTAEEFLELLAATPKRSLAKRLYRKAYLKYHNRRRWRKEVRWFIQRGRRGYADYDIWVFDHYLAKVIAGGVRQLITEMHGHPTSMCEECNVVPYAKHDCKGEERWSKILSDIAEGFEGYSKLYEVAYGSVEEKEMLLKFEVSRQLLIHWWGNLWD